MFERIQLIYWNKGIGIGKGKPYPYAPGKDYHGSVYKWRFRLGFVELRKWGRLQSSPVV